MYEANKYTFNDGVKLLFMAVDACLEVEGTVPGYIFLFDMKGVKIAHLARLSLSFLRKFFQYIQVINFSIYLFKQIWHINIRQVNYCNNALLDIDNSQIFVTLYRESQIFESEGTHILSHIVISASSWIQAMKTKQLYFCHLQITLQGCIETCPKNR